MPDSKTYIFEDAPIPKAIMTLAIPSVLSSLVMIFYNLADTYFVGMLGSAVENSAVTLAAPVLLAFNAVNNLFGIGSSSLMSRALGQKDIDAVRRSSAFGFWCSLLCGLVISVGVSVFMNPLLTLLGADELTREATREYMLWTVSFGAIPSILNVVTAYLVRAEGSALHASIGTMSGCLLNIVLDPIFILPWGLNMGAAGAGLATFLSNCFALGYFLVLLAVKRGRTNVCVNPKHFTLNGTIVSGVCAVGVPAAIQNLLNVVGMTLLNNFTSGYGADAVAAMGVAQKINQVPFFLALGISQGIMPLVGYCYAAGRSERMKKAFMFTARLAVVFLGCVTVAYYILAPWLIGAFMNNEAIAAIGTKLLRGFCLGLTFVGVDFLAVGVFQALGLGRMSLIFALLRKVALEIPLILILDALVPLYGMAYSQFAAELVLAVAACAVLARLFKRVADNESEPK